MLYKFTIQDEAGKPIPGAAVSFTKGGSVLVVYTADAAGQVTVDSETDGGLLEDDVFIRAHVAGYSDSGISAGSVVPDWTFTMGKLPPYGKYVLMGVGGTLLAVWLFSGNKKNKVGGFFDGMSTGAKLALAGGAGLAAYYLLFHKAGVPAGTLPATAGGDLATLHSQGQDPTITPSEAETYASELASAFEGCGTDEAAVFGVFRNMRNKADVLLLINTFAVRSYAGCFDGPIWKEDVDYNLGQAISSELGSSDISTINDILAGNGIDFKF